ncbi:Mitochondrial fission protein ELM1, partial [Linum perenne]
FRDGPLLVVASGRDTISVASSIKRLASEKVFVIQIQHPRSHLDRFDLVITPHHDYFALTPEGKEQVPKFMRRWITPQEPPDEHVVLTTGALHQIDFSTLRSAASAWHDELAPLPKPLLVLHSEPNPYMGHLAWADAFVVTADSVSMVSEACTTGYASETLKFITGLRSFIDKANELIPSLQ